MRLMLMRHARAESGHEKEDFQRNLTDFGREQANQAADFLCNYQIDKALVSYVKRTMQTASIISEKAPSKESEMITELYEGDEDSIINLISSQEDHNKYLLVIGHNPLIYNVAMSLSNNNSYEYSELISTIMPTARIIVIDFHEIYSWKGITSQKGNILKIFTPI